MYFVVSVCPSVSTLTTEPLNLWPWFFICRSTLSFDFWLEVKVVFCHNYYLVLRSRSKVRVKVKCQGQGHRSRSNFWCSTINIRGSALLSAALSNKSRYQSKMFVSVHVMAPMQLILLFFSNLLRRSSWIYTDNMRIWTSSPFGFKWWIWSWNGDSMMTCLKVVGQLRTIHDILKIVVIKTFQINTK